MSTPQEPNDFEPVTLDEIVQLMSEELTATDETRLRVRMAHDPNAMPMLERLRSVDSYFDRPGPVPVPADMPPEVTARLQAHLADLALRRAEGRLETPGRPAKDEDGDPEPEHEG